MKSLVSQIENIAEILNREMKEISSLCVCYSQTVKCTSKNPRGGPVRLTIRNMTVQEKTKRLIQRPETEQQPRRLHSSRLCFRREKERKSLQNTQLGLERWFSG